MTQTLPIVIAAVKKNLYSACDFLVPRRCATLRILAVPFGLSCSITAGPDGDELDTTGAELPEDRAVAEDILLACTIAAGALPWAPNDSIDVNEQLGKALDANQCNALARSIQAILLRDERYGSADVICTFSALVLSVRVTGYTDAGSFDLQLQQDGTTFRVVKVV